MRKPQTYKWYSYMRWLDTNKKITITTQLYQVGLYCVFEAPGFRDQRNTTPFALGKRQRKLLKQLHEDPNVTDIDLGIEKEAYKDEQGLWHEYNKETYGKTQKET